jgi:class 3 adenylate cyclase/tetratricopeptide (TPR) repeat protein
MKCPRCQHENRPGAKFCEECAASLARACVNCGAQLSATAKFCSECAHPAGLAAPPAPQRFGAPETYTPKHLAEQIINSKAALEGERKQVTVLFADLKGSMELLADRDPEEARKILDPVLELMMEAVHRYEGTVNQVMGDGIMALFGAPLALEDHAVRACYAALQMQEAVARYADDTRRSHGVEVQIRIGLNSGEVVVRSVGSDLRMDYTAVGQTTHLAARMEQLADPGTTLLTAETRALAGGFVEAIALGPMAVKGLLDPVEVYRLVGVSAARSRLHASAARGLSPFVGRDTELEQLRRAVEHVGHGRGQVAAVVGEPGVGKSRLIFELTHSPLLNGWVVLEAGASSHGTATSYLPISALLRSCLALDERATVEEIRSTIRARLSRLDEDPWPAAPAFAALLGVPVDSPRWHELEPRQRRQHTLGALSHLVLRESRIQPVLLIVEDLHWIDAESQAWLDGLVDALAAARVLLLVTYRPEYRHPWGNRTYYTQLRVDPLTSEDAEGFLAMLLGAGDELASLRALLIQRTDGNPFFLEESVQTLVETRALVGEPGARRLARPLGDVQVPATVQAILASRIDRLAPAEKQLLQSAAVVGKDVPFALLHAIASEAEEEVRRQLARLQSAEFLYVTRVFPEPEYTFKHALTQEVAYGSLLADRRRTIHARIVGELERLPVDRRAAEVERLAHHALRAELWEQAASYGRQAGAKAQARWALRDAGIHLEHALAATTRLPESRVVIEQAIDLRVGLRAAIHTLGEVERGDRLLREALSLAERLGDEVRIGTISYALSVGFWMLGRSDEAQAPNRRARAIAEATGNVLLGYQAEAQLGRLHHDRGDYLRAAAVLREFADRLIAAGDAARAAPGSAPLAVGTETYLGWALAELGEFAEAVARTEESLARVEAMENPFGLVLACMGVGIVRVRQGDARAAIPPLERGLRICYEFGLTTLAFHGIAASIGSAYALAGRATEAVPLLGKVADQAGAMKLISDHLLGAIPLGEVWLAMGRSDDAERIGQRSLKLARAHGQRGHEVYALRLLGAVAAHGEAPDGRAAMERYRSALELARALGMRPLVAHCHLGLGKLYHRASRREQAQEHLATATTMYRDMGMTYWLEQADAEMAELGR